MANEDSTGRSLQHGFVIPSILLLGFDPISILALTLSKTFKRPCKACLRQGRLSGLTESLSKNQIRTGRGRRNRPQTQRGCSQDL